MTGFPRISFGMIVLNGEPFVRYNLRALYPFAHEIIVVEGAAPGAKNIATADGHSRDGTLETLQRFMADEDPDDKVQIITRDGFWSEKDEMSQAYAEQATGDYLWQIDSDEFYHAEDMQAIITMLRDDPSITAVSFEMLTFWGNLDTLADGWYLRRGANIYHRLFKWGEGYTYVTHRPPTVHNSDGVDVRHLHWINGNTLAKKNIYMYHYSLLLPKQVQEKSDYYGNTYADFSGGGKWAQESFTKLKHPFHVHNVYRYPSWLERYQGQHPQQVLNMWHDLKDGGFDIDLRPRNDIDMLLNSRIYHFKRWLVKYCDYFARLTLPTLRSRIYFKLRLILANNRTV